MLLYYNILTTRLLLDDGNEPCQHFASTKKTTSFLAPLKPLLVTHTEPSPGAGLTLRRCSRGMRAKVSTLSSIAPPLMTQAPMYDPCDASITYPATGAPMKMVGPWTVYISPLSQDELVCIVTIP